MKSSRAYYQNGRFVPLGFGSLPEGTQAIVTLIDDMPSEIAARLSEFNTIMRAIHDSDGEEMPKLECIALREEIK